MKNLEITITNARKAFKEADEKGKTLLANMFGKARNQKDNLQLMTQ